MDSLIIENLDDVAKNLLGRTVYIDWPYLHEAFVIGVADLQSKIFLKDFWKPYFNNFKKDTLQAKNINDIKDKISEVTYL